MDLPCAVQQRNSYQKSFSTQRKNSLYFPSIKERWLCPPINLLYLPEKRQFLIITGKNNFFKQNIWIKYFLYLCKKVKLLYFRCVLNMDLLFFYHKASVSLYLWCNFYFYIFYNIFFYIHLVFVSHLPWDFQIFSEISFTPILSLDRFWYFSRAFFIILLIFSWWILRCFYIREKKSIKKLIMKKN